MDELDTELCIRSYKGAFETQITNDTMYCYNSRGTICCRASEICLHLTYFLCQHRMNNGKQKDILLLPLPIVLQGLNVLRSERLHNVYWHLLVHGLTFQALFAVLKCQSTFLPQCPNNAIS